jgi:hypothetical protein
MFKTLDLVQVYVICSIQVFDFQPLGLTQLKETPDTNKGLIEITTSRKLLILRPTA